MSVSLSSQSDPIAVDHGHFPTAFRTRGFPATAASVVVLMTRRNVSGLRRRQDCMRSSTPSAPASLLLLPQEWPCHSWSDSDTKLIESVRNSRAELLGKVSLRYQFPVKGFTRND